MRHEALVDMISRDIERVVTRLPVGTWSRSQSSANGLARGGSISIQKYTDSGTTTHIASGMTLARRRRGFKENPGCRGDRGFRWGCAEAYSVGCFPLHMRPSKTW